MSVQSLPAIFLLVLLVLLGARAESEVEVEVEDRSPPLDSPAPPNNQPWNAPVNTGQAHWMNPNTRPWNTRPWPGQARPWGPQPRQWSGPMGHVVPSFSGPRQNNGPWQAPPPIVQQPPFETSGNLEVLPGSGPAVLPPVQTVPMPGMQFPASSGYNPGCGFSRLSPCAPRYNMCGGGGGGGCSTGYNPGMNNGNNGYNPGSYVPASNLPAGIEFDNSNGNSGYNPGGGGFVPAANLPADIEFDNSGSGNGNSGYNPGCGSTSGNSYTPLPGRGSCYNVCGRKPQCQAGLSQGYRPPVCRSKCNIQPVCVGGNWNSGGGNSFVCGQNGGGGGFGYNPGYNSGYNPGYNSGYNPGYNQGGNGGRCGMRGGTCGDGGAASPGEVVVAARPGEIEEVVVPTIGPS